MSGDMASLSDTWRSAASRRAWFGFVFATGCVLCSLGTLSILSRRLPDVPRAAFDPQPLRRLRRERPEFVLLGNSMVETRIDERLLNKLLAPRRAISLATGGSMTALWYSQIQNYVVPAGYRPSRLVLFFRNAELTRPRDQTTGADLLKIQRASAEDSPVLAAKLIPPWRNRGERFRYEVWNALPVARLRRVGEALMDRAVLQVSTALGPTVDPKRRKGQINAVFRHARDGGEPEDPSDEDLLFNQATIDESLLPDILGLLQRNEIPTVFVRVRTRARARGVREPASLTRYITGLRRYIEERGAHFVDMSEEQWESIDLYGNGDHIAGRYTASYTRAFFAHEPALFR